LGALLATLIPLDPLVAVVPGVTVLHEPMRVAPGLIALGLAWVDQYRMGHLNAREGACFRTEG
jgi:hypothetical protein